LVSHYPIGEIDLPRYIAFS